MGGILSSALVALVLGVQEVQWLRARADHQRLGFPPTAVEEVRWRRYVDDLLILSIAYCGCCSFLFVSSAYRQPVSVCSGAGDKLAEPHIWCDVQLLVPNPQEIEAYDIDPANKKDMIIVIPRKP